MRRNTAYKLNNDILYEETVKVKQQKKIEELKSILNPYLKFMKFLFFVFIFGIVYVNFMQVKTSNNMEIEKLKKEHEKLEAQVTKLKLDIDKEMNMLKIEEYAKNNLDMEVNKDIIYVIMK